MSRNQSRPNPRDSDPVHGYRVPRKPQLYRLYFDDDDVDVALDIVNQQMRQGLVLLELSLIDEGVSITLPVADFDGQPIGEHLRALKKQWQSLLEP